MKKGLIVLLSIVGVIVLSLILIPIIFKKDIQEAIDKELASSLNATVYYDTDAFSLSLIKDFPDLTLSIGNFGIVGQGVFSEDTLVSVGTFQLTIDIMSVINGDEIKIVNVLLDQTDLKILVLEDGSANYDIAKPSDQATEESVEASSPLSIGIQGWEMRNSSIIYYDQSIPTYAILNGINHQGSGDFASDVFDMVTSTSINEFSVGYDGDEYITKKILTADITMAMDLSTMKFTFKENKLALNDFGFGLDGWVSMPASDIDMDLVFKGKEINLKSILSLIPGAYQEYLDGITASGNVAFDGYVKGTYSDTLMPKVASNFIISGGKIAYAGYPIPMEQIQVKASFDYPSADLRESSFIMEKFEMLMDGERVTSSLVFKDFEDYFWDFKLDGNLDLEKITKIFPMEGMELKGLISANLQTLGRMSDLDAEKYEKLTTNGAMTLSGFSYLSDDLPQGFGISSAKMSFNPKEIRLESFKGNAGLTDLNMAGSISNYLQYALSDSAILVGRLSYSSTLVDLNEWMLSTDSVEATPEDTTLLEIVRIPVTVDFELVSKIDLMKYDNLEIKDFNGKLKIRDGAITMEKVKFNLLDGAFEMNGAYKSEASLVSPLYDFGFKIEHLSISSSFEAFNTVKKLAPFAEKMVGSFSANLNLSGPIGEGMMPVYERMQGDGLIAIKEAAMQEVKLLTAVSNVTKLAQEDGAMKLKDVLLKTEIRDGRVYVDPFDFVLGGRKTTLSGSAGVDGSLDAAMLTNVPAGKAGDAASSLLSSLGAGSNLMSGGVDVTLGITGSYENPKVKLISAKPAGSNGNSALKDALKEQATQKVDAAKEQAKEVLDQKKDEAKEVVNEKKEEAKEVVEEQKDAATDKAKDELNNLLKKKKKGGGN